MTPAKNENDSAELIEAKQLMEDMIPDNELSLRLLLKEKEKDT